MLNSPDKQDSVQFSSLSQSWLFVTPWAAALQASLSITNSRSLPKVMSIESVMPSNHLILCRPLLLPPSIFPSIRVFSNESALRIRWPKYRSFSSTSVLPMNTQDWFPLGWTGLISLQSKGFSRVFSNTTVQSRIGGLQIWFLQDQAETSLVGRDLRFLSWEKVAREVMKEVSTGQRGDVRVGERAGYPPRAGPFPWHQREAKLQVRVSFRFLFPNSIEWGSPTIQLNSDTIHPETA